MATCCSSQFFFFFHERRQIGYALFHHSCRLDDLWQKHFALAEQVADQIHSVHEGTFDYLNRATVFRSGFFRVGSDVI